MLEAVHTSRVSVVKTTTMFTLRVYPPDVRTTSLRTQCERPLNPQNARSQLSNTGREL